MSKIKENKTLASENYRRSGVKKQEDGTRSCSIIRCVTCNGWSRKEKGNEQSFVLYGNYGRNRSIFHSGNRAVVDK